jgi:hypothetical protein
MATPAAGRPAARLDPNQLDQAVHRALARIPRDKLIHGPILVGIIAYPEGDKVHFQDIEGLAGPG